MQETQLELTIRGPRSTFDRPYLEQLGIRILDEQPGLLELRLNPYVRNHFDALHGAAIASLGEAAATLAGSSACGEAVVSLDLQVEYFALGRVGPFRTRTRILRAFGGGGVCRVELRDAGADDRLVSLMTVNFGPLPRRA